MSLLEKLLDVPGAVPPLTPAPRPPRGSPAPGASGLFDWRATGLSSFDPGPLVKIEGIPRPTGRAPVNPDVAYKVQIPRGARGTIQTLEKMGELAVEAAEDPGFVAIARSVVRDCGSRDHYCEANAILQYVHSVVTYRNDPVFAEHLESPSWVLLVEGQSDCDGQACLIAAMLLAVGRPARFAAYRLDRNRPDEFSHVMAQTKINGQWVGLDSIVPDPRVGWEPPRNEWLTEPYYLTLAG